MELGGFTQSIDTLWENMGVTTKIVELVLFGAIALFSCIFEGAFLAICISAANGYDRPLDPATLRFGFVVLVVGLFLMFRWGRRLWRIWRKPAAPQA